jgi:Ca2+-transporting ATPase
MSQGYSSKLEELVQALGANPETGLTTQQVDERLTKYKANRFFEEKEVRFRDILREEITEPIILLLVAVGVLYSIWGSLLDALTIITVIVILVLVEVWNEFRAKRSIDALRRFAAPTATVIRNGQTKKVLTVGIVPGDIIVLKPGDRVPADARLLYSLGLEIDESSLTGESFPVPKDATILLPEGTGVGEQQNMIFSGTMVTKGRAKAAVVSTGVNTEFGKVAGLTQRTKEPKTPLQVGMKQLSKTLVWIALFFSVLVSVLSFVRGLRAEDSVLYGLSIAFATIPEELPIIITMVLGFGAFSLTRKKAIVKRLRAAETLGNTTVIATDKTGTLTENRMRVESFYFDGKVVRKQDFGLNEKEALKTALLASEAIKDVDKDALLSNPMAQGILEFVKENGVDLQAVQKSWIFKDELSFDSSRKLASFIYQVGNSLVLLSSGAPENVLANSDRLLIEGDENAFTDESRRQAANAVSEMARTGQRLIAFGYRRITSAQILEKKNLEQNLVFVGAVGFVDPPRKEARDAIRQCQEAGIKVIMITGDHPETAKTVASQVGIRNSRVLIGSQLAKMNDDEIKRALRQTFVFARTTPEDKLRLVRLLKENGEVVAVTGDGVNDAPALKEAHIGIAMGIRGTDIAKEAADMVLGDDNFATIETSVREGRKIFANLKKGVRYYLACKMALVASFLLPIALGVPLPFAPIQIIVLELFMDLGASATFVAEPEEAGSMKKPPVNPNEKFINRSMKINIVIGALSLFVAVSTTYLVTFYQTQNVDLARTMAFATWMIGHIFLALNFRSEKEPLLKLGLLSNKVMVFWAAIVALTLIVGTNLAFLHTSLRITSLSLTDWAFVLIVAFVATFWIELKKLLGR